MILKTQQDVNKSLSKSRPLKATITEKRSSKQKAVAAEKDKFPPSSKTEVK